MRATGTRILLSAVVMNSLGLKIIHSYTYRTKAVPRHVNIGNMYMAARCVSSHEVLRGAPRPGPASR